MKVIGTPTWAQGSKSARVDADVVREGSWPPIVEQIGPQPSWEGISLGLAVLMILTVVQAVLSVVGLAIGLGLWD